MADRRVGDLLTAPKGLQLLDLISQCQAADLTDNDLSGLLPQLDFHVTRYRGDYEPYVDAMNTGHPGRFPLQLQEPISLLGGQPPRPSSSPPT